MFSKLLTIIFPTFGVIGVGWFARRINVWVKAAVEGLNNYAYYIALPALIFQSLVHSHISQHFALKDLVVFTVIVIVHLGILGISALFLSHIRKKQSGLEATFPTLITFGSTAYLGIPYATHAFGEEGTAYASILSVLLVTVLLLSSIFLFNRSKSENFEHPPMRSMLQLPFLWAVIGGLVWSFLHLPPLPDFLNEFVDSLAAGASATALLGLGAYLYDIRLKDLPWKNVLIASFIKVTVPSLIVFIVLKVCGIHGIPLVTGVALSAAPSGITCFILAEKYKLGERLTAGTIMISTGLSCIVFTLISYLWLGTTFFQ